MDIRATTPEPADFGLPPVLPGDWRALPDELEQALRQRLAASNLIDEGRAIEMVRVLPLGFFEGWMLCDFLLGEVGPSADSELAALVMLYGPDGFTPLDDYRRIERHVELHGVRLEGVDLCLSFVRFAAAFGALGEAPHFIAQGDGDAIAPPDVALAATSPSVLDGVRAPEAARISATMICEDELHRLELRLASDGMITVLARETLGPAATVEAVRREGSMRYGPRDRAEDAQ
jgi:hypothetical protein